MLTILADENMPYVDELFSDIGQIKKMAGRAITPDDLINVDVLLVRSITQVNASLLAKANRLTFVGSATIGTDHLDIAYLEQQGIFWTNAPGCNATAVAEYVLSALSVLAQRFELSLADKTVAIVGAGNIGQRLARKLTALGVDHFFCDPPLARAGTQGDYRDMNEVVKADIISLHVPINRQGDDITQHLVNKDFLSQLKPGTILLNSCRGDVVDNKALLEHLQQGNKLYTVIDVWQNEPTINLELLDLVDIATPHIAGYSLEGKARGTYMLYQQWCHNNNVAINKSLTQLLPAVSVGQLNIQSKLSPSELGKLIQFVYDIRDDDELCRLRGVDAKGFDNLRKQYKVRREFSAHSIAATEQWLQQQQMLQQLGFSKSEKQESSQ
ncbi:4-phosphoerythronate dehydrogenase [Psychrobium sp. 1_MG-2023]|uniref:4-phosphoerythronate dehydrogenase n=1 Tax=Psychrobium sp. 1_MG-2023 TaxID=3062624 RepID=UPI000C34913F|nr:4-phosphoerythronate dehydrogenase [Psychrobium sp. 1_MG-2023]MDP2561754.1 4-phosphoerythronate dehydrogenase [Psychrobium sp. 1_MG-2023]PKF59759.1 erythronate-4-phosphate dehydrogenase [Alteromonadales bacterium alter-6D02]